MFVGKSWKVVTKHLFHNANSKRGGVLMHSKVSLVFGFGMRLADYQVLIALFEKMSNPLGLSGSGEANDKKRKAAELDQPDIGGWAYMGSHNFTPSAWVRFASPRHTRREYVLMQSRAISGSMTSPRRCPSATTNLG
jgi:tyrosyl-DNA phosphodiesterase-1